jgi:hypothetical protein
MSHLASHVVASATALMPVSPVASRRTYLIRCDRCDGATAGLDSDPIHREKVLVVVGRLSSSLTERRHRIGSKAAFRVIEGGRT